ncbi:helix-turn-helix domain-containing protein [Bacillus sp. AK031]
MTEFGENLRRLRKEKGFTIRKLSELSGIANSYISQVETGKRGIPKIDTLEKIANGLSITSLELLQLAGYISVEKVGYKEEIEEFIKNKAEIRSLNETIVPDLDHLLSSNNQEVFFKSRLLSRKEKTTIKKLIKIYLED